KLRYNALAKMVNAVCQMQGKNQTTIPKLSAQNE
ncbi:MAG: hypothetical protein RL368_2355, partial [Pseudomonadota bacterium]